jgi:hypothetical protein
MLHGAALVSVRELFYGTAFVGGKPQVPPLRFAPVGMTILLRPQVLQREIPAHRPRIVILTGAKRSGRTCGFFPEGTFIRNSHFFRLLSVH